MDKDTNELRSEIEDTRSRLGDTVEAIGYKADIPNRAKDAIADKVDAVKSAVSDGVDVVKSAVSDTGARIVDAMPTGDDLRAGADRVSGMIKDNAVGVAVGSIAVGFLMGLLLPRTSIESERINDVKQMAKDAGAQAVETGKQIVRETIFGKM
jgi:hypothetical protein